MLKPALASRVLGEMRHIAADGGEAPVDDVDSRRADWQRRQRDLRRLQNFGYLLLALGAVVILYAVVLVAEGR